MTEKLYYKDSFLSEFEALVLSCEQKNGKFEAVLDKTAFFPESGGQTADGGTIDGIEVIDVYEKDEKIVHITKAELPVGKRVKGCIDMKERLRKMQNHTGEHMISGAAHRLFGANNFGFHLGQEFVTCDLDIEFTEEQINRLEDTVNMWAVENHAVYATCFENQALVNVDYRSKTDFEGNVRIITIDGCDSCACCAPHVSFTGQVGIIKIIDSIRYKGGTRITAVCGADALKDYRMLCKQNADIQHALSAKRHQTAQTVERVVKERDDAKFQSEKYGILYVTALAEQAKAKGENIVFLESVTDTNLIIAGVNVFDGNCAVLCGDNNSYSFAARVDENCQNELIKQIKTIPASSGGGRDGFIRGRINCEKDKIVELFKKYL